MNLRNLVIWGVIVVVLISLAGSIVTIYFNTALIRLTATKQAQRLRR